MTTPMREHALRTPDADARTRVVVQRKCGCGGSCGPCAEEKKKKIQRRATGETSSEIPKSVGSILGSAGRPLDEETRASMESRFGRSFADVRVHTDTHAADSAKEIHAAAYTSGTHIVFGAGRFAPHTPEGHRLLAHELAHVVQQRGGTALQSGIGPADDAQERAADRIADAVVARGPVFAPPPAIVPVAERLVRRKREDDLPETAQEESQRFIVEDSATPTAGQMRRSEFVEELDAAVCATSREEMASLGQSTDGCPLLEQWRPRIRAMSTRQLEVSIRRWIESDATIRNARDYIPRVTARLTSSIRTWGKTGQILGIPPDLLDLFAGGKIKVSVGGLIRGAIGSLFRKARDGAPAPATAVALDARGGRPLDATVATRMGRAFGRDFSDVRVHTGAEAGAAASRVNARAFTIGSDIAFASGEYAPGTLVGDALLAHELAHVAQQDGAAADGVLTKGEDASSALETDADDAAVHAVVALWPRAARFLGDVRANAMPRLKSGLKLRRCSNSPEDLQKYLAKIDKDNKIEGGGDSDDKARDVAEAWSGGDTQYVLSVRRKRLLIEEMLDGDVSRSDQKQILNLLERSFGAELEQMIGPNGVPHSRLLKEFGAWKEELWRFYMRRYSDAYGEKISNQIMFGDEGPSPMPPPDLAKLDATRPSETFFSVVQPGDELPETTQPLRVQSKRSTSRKLDKGEAAKWVRDEYGKHISKDQEKAVTSAPVHRDPGENREFVEFIAVCIRDMDPQNAAERERADAMCRAEEPNTAAFYDPQDNSISVRNDRESPSTMVHEVIHAFAHENARALTRYAKEGLTEYFTRRILARHPVAKGEKRLYAGGHYTDAYDAVLELAIVVGDDRLARAHFGGDVKGLCDALGKDKFDAWVAAMADRDNGTAATNILRGVTPVKKTTAKCT